MEFFAALGPHADNVWNVRMRRRALQQCLGRDAATDLDVRSACGDAGDSSLGNGTAGGDVLELLVAVARAALHLVGNEADRIHAQRAHRFELARHVWQLRFYKRTKA